MVFLEPQFIPVAHLLDECYLLIDKTNISTDPNYLWFHGLIEYEPMQLNFEIFLDRYIFYPKGQIFGSGISIPLRIITELTKMMTNHFLQSIAVY